MKSPCGHCVWRDDLGMWFMPDEIQRSENWVKGVARHPGQKCPDCKAELPDPEVEGNG